MRKRRSTVYVRPGKDVTLYVPTETPSEVIDFLNGLKRDGYFSQGVMDIVTEYVMSRRAAQRVGNVVDGGFSLGGEQGTAVQEPELFGPLGGPEETKWGQEATATADSSVSELQPSHQKSEPLPGPEQPAAKWNLSQIFSQARRNAGKLTEPDE